MKKNLSRMLLAAMMIAVLLLSACGNGASSESAKPGSSGASTAATGDIKFAVVFDLGGIGDNGYNMEIHQACLKLAEKYNIGFDFVEPKSVNDYETQLRMYADSEEYAVIFGVSYSQADPMRLLAPDYPDQKFALLDTVVDDVPNIHSLSAFHPEQHFLSGVISGLVTQDERMEMSNPENIIGFAIAMDSPVSRAQAAGFMAGARYVNQDVEFITNYIGSYKDPAKAKEIAMTAFGRGADIVCQNAGASGMGVFAAGEEAGGYVIASSLATITEGYTLSVSVKRMETFLEFELQSVVDGTWKAGSTQLGIKDGACGYSIENTGVEIPADIIEIVEKVKQEFIDGKITLPNDIEEIDEWSASNTYSA